MKKVLINASLEKIQFKELKPTLKRYVFNYNNTEHSTTDKSATSMLFNYKQRSHLDLDIVDNSKIDNSKIGNKKYLEFFGKTKVIKSC